MKKSILYKPLRKLLHLGYRVEKALYGFGLLSTRDLTLPDFLCIGAMKSASTWLHENLRCHPDLHLPDVKEVYFFSVYFHSRSFSSYSHLFSPGKSKIKGEVTPDYYSNIPLSRIRLIHKLLPNLKLIFLMRNPIERAWSEAYMNLVAKPTKRMTQPNVEQFIEYFQSPKCRARSQYVEALDRWLSVFPKEQWLNLFTDDIAAQPRVVLTRIFEFLDVSAQVDWQRFPYNKVIVPKYERDFIVRHGESIDPMLRSEATVPEQLRNILIRDHAEQIKILQSRYGAPLQWSEFGTS